MFRTEQKTMPLKRPAADERAVVAHAGFAAAQGETGRLAHDESDVAERSSFLIVLLRALSAWNV